MSKKETVAEDEAAKLEDAVTRAQREIELFKNWLANGGRHSPSVGKPSRTSTHATPPSTATHSGTVSVGGSNSDYSTRLLQRNVSQLKWGGLIAVVVILFAAFALIVSGYRNTQTILQQIALSGLQITEPADGASVSEGQTIRGNTPYPRLNHYFVLTDATGHVSIQPARVSSAGSFAGEVTLNAEGADAAKQPDEILLRVLATQEQLVTGSFVTYPDDAKLSSHVRLLPKPVDQIVISSPAEGATVGMFEQVIGTSHVGDLKHYILVRPVKSGAAYIQEQPVAGNNGNLTGRAQFGTASVGIGQQFTVEIIATSTTLAPGLLNDKPTDAVTSKPITVRRK